MDKPGSTTAPYRKYLPLAASSNTAFYVSIMPPYLPRPAAIVYVSGAAEVLLGLELLFRRTERLAAWGPIAMVLAVTPINVHIGHAHSIVSAIPPDRVMAAARLASSAAGMGVLVHAAGALRHLSVF